MLKNERTLRRLLDVDHFQSYGVWRMRQRKKCQNVLVMPCVHVRIQRSGVRHAKRSHPTDYGVDTIVDIATNARASDSSAKTAFTDMFRFARQKFPSVLLDQLGSAYWIVRTTDAPVKDHIYLTSAQTAKIDPVHWRVKRLVTITRHEWRRTLRGALNKPP